MKLHICLTTDSRWLRSAQRAVYDIIIRKNPETEIKFYVLGESVEADDLADAFLPFADVPGIEAVTRKLDATAIFGNLSPAWPWLGPFKHLKFLIPDLDLFAGVERVLYMDVDMLARRDLSDVYAANLGGHALGAVRDYLNLRFPNCRAAFNEGNKIENGLLIMDLPKLRRRHFTDYCIYAAKENRDGGDLPVLESVALPLVKFFAPAFEIPFHLISSEPVFRDITRWNDLNRTDYASVDDLVGQSYLWHYSGDKEMFYSRIPHVKTAFDLSEARLARFLSTGEVMPWQPSDDSVLYNTTTTERTTP